MAKKVTMSGTMEKPRPFKVRALQMGYYDNIRRRVGDVFVIQGEHEFSTRWMDRVPLSTPERITGPNAAIREHHDDILSGGTSRVPSVLGDDADELANDNPIGG